MDHTSVPAQPYIVFADVDETLINLKSMFDFQRYQLAARHGNAGIDKYDRIHHDRLQSATAGTPREEINRAYYAGYAGNRAETMADLGRRWFAERDAQGLFIEETREALRAHKEAGAELALVSGSFPACLDPVAEAVGARHLICTRPLVRDGIYTGEIETPMIGAAKQAAVQRLLATRPDIDPADCYAYGDHPSDLPMFDCVGHPVPVGDHPDVLAYLDTRTPHLLESRR